MRALKFLAALAIVTSPAKAAGPFIWYGPYAKNIAASGEQNPDGTAAAPSLTFTSDTNTGFYRAGSDQIGFATNGTARATVDTEWNMLADIDIGSQKIVTGASRFLHKDGTNSVFLGVNAGTLANTGASNTAAGVSSLGTLTSGTSNTAIGTSAAFRTTSAGEVTAVGANAGRDQTGNSNTWVGSSAGLGTLGSSDGIENTGVGVSALQLVTTGDFNTGVGTYAGRFITTGSNNTAIGYQALYGVNTGGTNVAVGQNAGDTITTGTANTFVGTNADAGSSGLTNATAIGANASVTASNALVLGSSVNVGIGTTAPNSKLQVESTATGADSIFSSLESTSATGNAVYGYTKGVYGVSSAGVRAGSEGTADALVAEAWGSGRNFVLVNPNGDELGISAPSGAFTGYNLTLPTDDGTAFDSLTTNGSGTLSWAAQHKAWNTVVKTANYTAVSYDEIFADTTGGSFTITLPASPATGDRVRITISKGGTNNLTVDGGTKNIYYFTTNYTTGFLTCIMTGELVYDGTQWIWAHGTDGGCS